VTHHPFAVAVPVLDTGPVALAAIAVEVNDLSHDTIAAVTAALVLAAHGLERELDLNHQARHRGAADIAG
jgi:hypothetical protein